MSWRTTRLVQKKPSATFEGRQSGVEDPLDMASVWHEGSDIPACRGILGVNCKRGCDEVFGLEVFCHIPGCDPECSEPAPELKWLGPEQK